MKRRVGRVSRQVRRCLIASSGEPVRFAELVDRAYLSSRGAWRWPIYRALKRWGVSVGYGKWMPNAELMRQIRGE